MAPKADAFSSLKPNVNQLEAGFNNDVGFATVYLRIYRCIQSDVVFHSFVH